MSTLSEITKCPHCRETIAVGASICKHCHSEIKTSAKPSWLSKYNTFRLGFLVGVLFSAVLLFLYYYHFVWGIIK
jgi:hypothetical protein